MKKTNSIGKKALSVFLSALMCFSVFALCFTALPLKADAAVTVSGSAQTAAIVVPETIYLTPANGNMTTFQFYLNNNNDGTVKAGYETNGSVYFNCTGATGITATLENSNVSLELTNGEAKNFTGALTNGYSADTVNTLKWTFTFTDAKGVTRIINAYTVVYAPYLGTVACENARKRANWQVGANDRAMANGTVWLTGFENITKNSEPARDADGAFNHTPLLESHISSAGITGVATTTSCGNNNNDPSTGNDLRYTTGTGYTGYWQDAQKSSGTVSVPGQYDGNVKVDFSRVSNLNQIPNLCCGVDVQEQWDANESRAGTLTLSVENSALITKTAAESPNAKQNYQGYRFGSYINYSVETQPSQVTLKAQITARVATVEPTVKLNLSYVNKNTLRGNYENCVGSYMKLYFTDSSWATYETNLKNAATVLGNPKSTSGDVSAADSSLTSAKNALVYKTGTATVTHKSTSGKTIGTETKTYNYGQTVTATANSYNGYTSPASAPYVTDITSATWAETLTYTINTYTLTAKYDDGTTSDTTAGFNIEGSVSMPAAPSKTGYNFAGWKVTSASGNWEANKFYSAGETVSAKYGNVTITAQWIVKQYSTAYDLNYAGSTGTPETSVTDFGSPLTLPVPSREGYTFAGWYTEKGLINKVESGSATPAENRTLYASWTINQYTATFKNTDGSVLSTSTVDYGTAPSVPASPKKDSDADKHYTFSGWNDGTTTYTTDKIPVMGASAVTYTPVFTAENHDWNTGVVTTAPTCIATGVRTFTCKVCGKTKTETLSVIDHDWNSGEWTWSADGKTASVKFTCKVVGCGETETVTASVSGTVKTAATCTAKGTTTYTATATFNGNTYTDTKDVQDIEIVAHVYGEWTTVTAATCTAKGLEKRTCVNCGTAYEENELPVNPDNHTSTVTVINAKAATCTEDGYTGDQYYPCCDKTEKTGEVITKTGHNFGDWMTKTAATCVTAGEKQRECSYCNITDSAVIPVDSSNHENLVVLPAVEPTCTETGLTEGEKCEACGVITKAQETVDALGHDYIDHDGQAATCTENGWKAYRTCSRCDYTSYEAIIATGHSLVHHDAKAADCENIGWNAYDTCENCDYTTYVEIPALGHEWGTATCKDVATCSRCHKTTGTALGHDFNDKIAENVTIVPATCTVDGTKTVKCVRCDETETTVLKAPGHKDGEKVTENRVEATCETDGSYDEVVYCTICGTERSRDNKKISATGHTVDIIPEVKPTCTKTGLTAGAKCVVCEKVLADQTVVDALGHTEVVIEAVPATCTATGLSEGKKCSVCGEILVAQTVTDKAPHTPGSEVKENVVPATCTAMGSYDSVIRCTVCNTVISSENVVTDMVEHIKVKIPGKAATCLKDGLTDGYKCAVCGLVITAQEVIPAPGHDYVKNVRTEATCSRQGVIVYNCSRCYDSYTEIIDKLEHAPAEAVKENIVAATCTKTGSYDMVVRCEMCETVLSSEHFTTEKASHREVEIAAVPATCSSTGLTAGVKCAICGEVLKVPQITDKTDHDPVKLDDVAPTCVNAGYKNKIVCSVCGQLISSPEIVPATGHAWGEWVTVKEATETEDGVKERTCSVCGAKGQMNYGVSEMRLIRFYTLSNLYYVLDDESKVTATRNIPRVIGEEVKFRVALKTGFGFDDYIIYADGQPLAKDADGYYTIPGGVNNVVITVDGVLEVKDNGVPAVGDDSGSSTHRMTFWEWLLMIFRKIAAFFTGKK